MNRRTKILIGIGLISLAYFCFTAYRIHSYSKISSHEYADVAIVLGAGTNNGILSAVYRERVNHSIKLYHKGVVNQLIFTGDFGQGQSISDSKCAKNFAVKNGIPKHAIIIEDKSAYTIENIIEAKHIIDSLNYSKAIIVSDPIHMKRAIDLAINKGINCLSSPTETTMYRSFSAKFKFLMSETFYYCGGELSGKN